MWKCVTLRFQKYVFIKVGENPNFSSTQWPLDPEHDPAVTLEFDECTVTLVLRFEDCRPLRAVLTLLIRFSYLHDAPDNSCESTFQCPRIACALSHTGYISISFPGIPASDVYMQCAFKNERKVVVSLWKFYLKRKNVFRLNVYSLLITKKTYQVFPRQRQSSRRFWTWPPMPSWNTYTVSAN